MKIIQIFLLLLFGVDLAAQSVETPNPDYLFDEDSDAYTQLQRDKRSRVLKSDEPVSQELQMNAPDLKYLTEEKKIQLKNGLVISRGNFQAKANEGVVDMQDKSAELKGNVFLSWPTGSLSADKAKVYIEDETGVFQNAGVYAEESDFKVEAEEAKKLSEFDYIFNKTNITPCHCSDGSRPWSFSCSELKIREEGYGKAKDFKIKVNDTSVFYLPYAVFPFKRERQSGFLAPDFGYSNRNGATFTIPYFWDVNESTDVIIRPFTETKTRTGLALDYNQVFSTKSKVESRLYYSDESVRDGALRGTVVSNVFDPTIDDSRLAGFIRQNWRNAPDAAVPLSWVSDIHFVSDDLILREFDDEELGSYNSRFATSRTAFRADFGELLAAELLGEYNQSILTDDDLIFQRAPELNLYSSYTMRPFGQNPYGIKLVASNKVQATSFIRDMGYEGKRYDVNPGLKIPYHYKNYFNGELKASLNSTQYSLDNNQDPINPENLITDDKRNVYTISGSIGTELEKVSEVSPYSTLAWLTNLGRKNQEKRLVRLKNTVEPKLSVLYVPFEDQDSLPLFDSLDRLRERRLATFGVKSSFYGRFEPVSQTADRILELAPEVDELPSVSSLEPISEAGLSSTNEALLPVPVLDKGEVRELFNFSVYQTYDHLEAEKDLDPLNDEWSDLGLSLGMFPSSYFALTYGANLDLENHDFSSWSMGSHFRDDRGDKLRFRYSYLENVISQIEANLEIALTAKTKLGYYARYDETNTQFIDNMFALRFSSACDCWDFDLGFRERINPNKKDFIASVTLRGLGKLAQGFSLLQNQNGTR